MGPAPSTALITAHTTGDLFGALMATLLFVLPGLPMGIALARRLRWSAPAAVVTAFAVSTAAAAVVMLAGTAAGLSLAAGIAAWLVLAIAATIGAGFLGRHQPRLTAEWPAFVLALVAGAFALVERPWFKMSSDTFYHLAAARSLLVRDALTVTDPFFGTAVSVPDPSSGVWHTMLAMGSRLTGMDATQLFTGLGVLGAMLGVLAFYLLARRFAGTTWAAAAATAAYMLCGQLLDYRAAAYPNRMSLALVLLGVACLAALLEGFSWPAAAVAVIAGVAVSATHVGNAEFFFLLGAALLAWALIDGVVARFRGERRFEWRSAARVAAVLGVAGAGSLPLLLPKFGLVVSTAMAGTGGAATSSALVHLGPLVVARPGALFDGGVWVFAGTAALALAAGWWAFARRDRSALAAFALLSAPLLLLAFPPLTTLAARSYYNLVRIAALLGFTTYLAIAWALGRVRVRGGFRWVAVVTAGVTLVACLLAAQLPLLLNFTRKGETVGSGIHDSVWRSRQGDVRVTWGEDALAAVTARIGTSAPVVAAVPDTGYTLAAFASVRLVAVPPGHSPLAIESVDGPQRREDMRRLFVTSTSETDRRAILKRWKADCVLVFLGGRGQNRAAPTMLAQTGLFERLGASSDTLLLLRVKR